MPKENIPLLSDEFLDEVTKEINEIYGFENDQNEAQDKDLINAEENIVK
ncbi:MULTISPECIES: hypothetical protein [Bacillaceae]|nr:MULTISPECIES: hypothetical protein [Bacillaceae]